MSNFQQHATEVQRCSGTLYRALGMAASLPKAWVCSAVSRQAVLPGFRLCCSKLHMQCLRCGLDDAGGISEKKRAAADMQLVDEKARAKKFKATELAPSKATKAVWSSIFLSSRPEEKETYGCRALSSRGWA